MSVTPATQISVVMPVRNGGDFLTAAVQSILNQQNVSLELIIVDDHSKDDAVQNLQPDERLRVISSPQPGLVAALNCGVQHAKFDLIARMDGDDIAHPQRLSKQLEYLAIHPEVSVCGCVVDIFAQDSVADGYRFYQDWINSLLTHQQIETEFFIESPIAHPSAVFYKSMWTRLGGYRDGDWPEDYDFWCRALLKGYRFGKPNTEALLDWRDYPTRTSRTDSRYRKNAFIECKARTLSAWLRTKGKTSIAIWGAGPTGLALHDALARHDIETNEFIDVNPKMQGRLKRDKKVRVLSAELLDNIDSKLSDLRMPPRSILNKNQHLVIAVAARGARAKIRSFLLSNGWTESIDFTFAA